MLKFIVFCFVLVLIPICFLMMYFEWFSWMVMLFLISFMLILFNIYCNYFINISYFLGCDSISYGLILLSFWICALMLMASEKINKFKNCNYLFMIN